jgi:OOP family OmpA-OmpF porin
MKQFAQIDAVQVTGHADRIGSDANNMKISQMRAQAVKAYLVSQGIDANRIGTADKGAAEPVVACNDVKGKAVPSNTKLVQCLQPNRRVVVDVKGLK